ncbi:hypothetical protein [uncultured Eudoraea sp.]|uniref:hypothetical protein n=1 Tax=uncultured Eudoraea sp. TaxID=1035614 RepID=UPI0026095D9C|nr:hypothetical protein [uncultured Eudoraea sp.]
MKLQSVINNRIQATIGAFILTFACILWEYFNGGVVSHHLLAREDLPAFSNWWGLLTVPLLFWIAISLINRRQENSDELKSNFQENETAVFRRFIAALVFGILISLLWEFKFESILKYLILFPILVAFFIPVHLPEYLMGFVLGMIFTFGGVLPIIIGVILLVACLIINRLVRFFRTLIKSKAG